MAAEIWRPILGFEKFYQVSNRGRVRSLARSREVRYSLRNGDGSVMERLRYVQTKDKILKPRLAASGYLEVCLRVGATQRMAYVQRLVLEAFVGPCAGPRTHAAHLNGRRIDNRLDNLVWATPVENLSHRKYENYTPEISPYNRTLSPKKITAARVLHSNGWLDADIAEVLSLSAKKLKTHLAAATP